MASNIQLTKEVAANIPAAGASTKNRLFIDESDGFLKLKDDGGVVTDAVSVSTTFPGSTITGPVIVTQTLVGNEVLTVGAIGSSINFDLPALAGVTEAKDLYAVVDVTGVATTFNITITPDGADTIDGVGAPITITTDYGLRGLIKTSATNWTVIYTNVGDVLSHAPTHILGAGDEIDADQLGISWDPSNYVPTTSPIETTSVDHLTAHLAGIDAKLGQLGAIDATLQTTDATPTVIATVPTVTNNVSWIEVTIQGRDNTANEVAVYKIFAAFDNAGGTVTQQGSTAEVFTHEDDASWAYDLNVSGTDVQIRVTGDVTNTVEWSVIGSYNTHG